MVTNAWDTVGVGALSAALLVILLSIFSRTGFFKFTLFLFAGAIAGGIIGGVVGDKGWPLWSVPIAVEIVFTLIIILRRPGAQ